MIIPLYIAIPTIIFSYLLGGYIGLNFTDWYHKKKGKK